MQRNTHQRRTARVATNTLYKLSLLLKHVNIIRVSRRLYYLKSISLSTQGILIIREDDVLKQTQFLSILEAPTLRYKLHLLQSFDLELLLLFVEKSFLLVDFKLFLALLDVNTSLAHNWLSLGLSHASQFHA